MSCPDRPYKGLYFFKNIGTPRHPRFAAAERISEKGMNNIRLSEVDGKPYVLSKNFEYPDVFKAPYAKKRRLHYEGEELGATDVYKRQVQVRLARLGADRRFQLAQLAVQLDGIDGQRPGVDPYARHRCV